MALLKFTLGIADTFSKALANRTKLMKETAVPMKRASALVFGSVQQNFRAGGRPGKWEPLSKMTRFIRSHRSAAPNRQAVPLRDKGRLAGSITPHWSSTPTQGEFGAGTNVGYAGDMHFGGLTKPSTVLIASFMRRNPRVATSQEAAGLAGAGLKLRRSAMSRVSAYIMRLKGGHKVPGRPYLMVQEQDKPRLSSIFAEWMSGTA